MGTLCCIPEILKGESLVDALFPDGIITCFKTDGTIQGCLPAAVIQCFDKWAKDLFPDKFRPGLCNHQFSPECRGNIGQKFRGDFTGDQKNFPK